MFWEEDDDLTSRNSYQGRRGEFNLLKNLTFAHCAFPGDLPNWFFTTNTSIFFFFVLAATQGKKDLSSQTRDRTFPLQWRHSLNHWITWELSFSNSFSPNSFCLQLKMMFKMRISAILGSYLFFQGIFHVYKRCCCFLVTKSCPTLCDPFVTL